MLLVPRAKGRKTRQRGNIEKLPSGALRVRVYAGIDPVTKRRHDLKAVIPAGPKAYQEAEQTLTRFLNQLDERRNPKTNATVNQLLDKHLEMFDGEESTLRSYRRHVDNHVRPLIGSVKVAEFDGEVFDSFYRELRRCRAHCDGRRNRIDHRTGRKHDCDERCRPHQCQPTRCCSTSTRY